MHTIYEKMRRESRGESELYNQKLAEATFAYRESLAKALAKEKWSRQDSSNCFEHRSFDVSEPFVTCPCLSQDDPNTF